VIDIKKFSALEKNSKQSFAKQKQKIKKVMAGQTVLCLQCQKPLYLFTPKSTTTTNSKSPGIRCAKGCTDLQLDFV
jgi:hypothetical protein